MWAFSHFPSSLLVIFFFIIYQFYIPLLFGKIFFSDADVADMYYSVFHNCSVRIFPSTLHIFVTGIISIFIKRFAFLFSTLFA